MALLSGLLQIIAPKKKSKKGGISSTPTFNAANPTNPHAVPQYREHLVDLFASRTADDSRTLVRDLIKSDPDVAATVNSYLTLADTVPTLIARDLEGNIDREATKDLAVAVQLLSRPIDYTLGFQFKQGLRSFCEELRYMLLLRGSIGVELVLNEKLLPSNLRNVDMATVEWREPRSGDYKPFQKPAGSNTEINLDVPTFFTASFRRDPTNIYTWSFFTSAINTIAARQMVINDLYRIMHVTGWPRVSIKVIEETLRKNVPVNIKNDEAQIRTWINARFAEIRGTFDAMRADHAFVHSDAVEPSIINDKNSGVALDIAPVIETLNAQNQAGLKTMATVIGRGNQGVNTASVEARIAAMNADEINDPIAELLSNVFSFILHQQGFQGFVEVSFAKVELRPSLELEPQLLARATRLRQDLSDGLITDDEFHMWMYGRVRPDSAPELSGTGFLTPVKQEVDSEQISTNDDPLGKSLTPDGGNGIARSNQVRSPKK